MQGRYDGLVARLDHGHDSRGAEAGHLDADHALRRAHVLYQVVDRVDLVRVRLRLRLRLRVRVRVRGQG